MGGQTPPTVSSASLSPSLPVSSSLISAPDGPLDLEDRLLGELFSLTPEIIILGSSVWVQEKILCLGNRNPSPKFSLAGLETYSLISR